MKENKLSLLFGLLLMSIVPLFSRAQEVSDGVEMAGVMRENGKIYVVVAVLVIIFLFILIYLIRLERKLNRLEKGEGNDKIV